MLNKPKKKARRGKAEREELSREEKELLEIKDKRTEKRSSKKECLEKEGRLHGRDAGNKKETGNAKERGRALVFG